MSLFAELTSIANKLHIPVTIGNHEPWMWLPPGLMILIAVLSINFVGDGLRDAIEARN
jgi:peptide/nickel transport system permease protein